MSPTSRRAAAQAHAKGKRGHRSRTEAQQAFAFRTWGGRRAGAGRKPSGSRAGVPHVARPAHCARHPVHLTLRAVRRLPSLRRQLVFLELRRGFVFCSKPEFRVIHFSVQADHLHLIVEAHDRAALSRGARGLSIRLARAVNRVLGRHGRVWGDRYHARPLRTPHEVRLGLVYVLANWRKHIRGARGLDPCASGVFFDGWQSGAARQISSAPPPEGAWPVVRSQTWLGSKGWRRYGLLDLREHPKDDSNVNRRVLRGAR